MADQLPEVQEMKISSKAEITMDEFLSTRKEADKIILTEVGSKDGRFTPEDLNQDSDSLVTQKCQQLLAEGEAQSYAKEPQKHPQWEKASWDEDGGYTLINKDGKEISKPPKTVRIDSTIDTLDAIAENSATPPDIQARAITISANFKKHIGVLVNGEELDYNGYKLKLAAGDIKREDVQFRLYVKEKTEPTATAESATAGSKEETSTTETLSQLDIDKIHGISEKVPVPIQYSDELLTLADIARKEGVDATLPRLLKLDKKYKLTPESKLKFVQMLYELTGQTPSDKINDPSLLYLNLLANEDVRDKLSTLSPDDPDWKNKLQAIKDKKGIQIALGILSKGKPDLYKMVLIMTLFQMYEQSQERQ
jgi:hypothetical protein